MPAIITLTTDFGPGSPYVGQMKGVILSLCRDVQLIDISHAIRPQNIREAAVVLADATPRFPPSTIHVAVIDPGVGTARRIAYAQFGDQHYIAPDNGLLSRMAARQPPSRIVALTNRRFWLPQPSHTFHGRDIMAPAAAHLACGVNPAELGQPLDALTTIDWSQPRISASRITGEVLYVDSFGNLIANIEQEVLAALGNPGSLTVTCGGKQIRGLVPTYGAALSGELVALIDSQGRLEIALVGGSAAAALNVQAGDSVEVA
jgi:S-adenosylmethionine hydrolase